MEEQTRESPTAVRQAQGKDAGASRSSELFELIGRLDLRQLRTEWNQGEKL